MSQNAVIDTSTILNFIRINRFDLFGKLKIYLLTTVYVVIEMEHFNKENKLFAKLIEQKKIVKVSLTIKDLVEMASIPDSKKISDEELSCYVKARQINCSAISDDKKANKFVKRYLDCLILGTSDLIKDAYCEDILDDYEVKKIQEVLMEHKFIIKEDLLYEAAQMKNKVKVK